MMMSNPEETASDNAAAATISNSETTRVKPPTPLDAVADLERRLKELSTATPHIAPIDVPDASTTTAPAFAMAPPVAAAASAPAAAASGKNALLARIMAAQERAKQQAGNTTTTTMAAPATTPDFLMSANPPPPLSSAAPAPPPPSFDSFLAAPTAMTNNNTLLSGWDTTPVSAVAPTMPPPPAFDLNLLGMPTAAPPPPSFDMASLPPPSTTQQQPVYLQWDPHAPSAPSAASAPAFEDLMDNHHHNPHPPAMMPPSMQTQSTTDTGLDEEALAMILGMEGLTAAEKQEMIDEQLKILKSIEDSKKSSQMSAADAFEQRSYSAAVQAIGGRSNNRGTNSTNSQIPGNMQLNGQERTREAIADGTAVMVQCTACANWMQVTGSAQLMFCPVCQTVSPVQGSGLTAEEAQQMADDAKLAEQLQNEEYEEADRANSSTAARSGSASGGRSPSRTMGGVSSKPSAAAASSGSWMEWLGFGTPAPAPTNSTSSNNANNTSIQSARSHDSDEGDNLLSGAATGRSRAGGAARIATSQPLFACVTDSIHSAANYAMNGIQEDEEGNVHGVDSSSLLAVTQVGRGGGGGGTDSSNQRYESLPDRS